MHLNVAMTKLEQPCLPARDPAPAEGDALTRLAPRSMRNLPISERHLLFLRERGERALAVGDAAGAQSAFRAAGLAAEEGS